MSAFSITKIESIEFPSSIEANGQHAFQSCNFLKSVPFQENSKLRSVGYSAFPYSIIESTKFTPSYEDICDSSYK